MRYGLQITRVNHRVVWWSHRSMLGKNLRIVLTGRPIDNRVVNIIVRLARIASCLRIVLVLAGGSARPSIRVTT
jgi:hypothetical protein